MNEHFRDYSIRDLRDFGIGHLTGESCAISLRILYDLTEGGVRHIENSLSIKLADNSPANWNRYVGSVPAVKSIKMSPDQAYHVLICILASRFEVVVEFTAIDNDSRHSSCPILMAGNTEGYESYTEAYLNEGSILDRYNARFYQRPTQNTQPHTGLDNYHAFSGRT